METKRLYLREETTEILNGVLNQSIQEQLNFFGLQDRRQLQRDLLKIERKLQKEVVDWKKWNLVEKDSGIVIGSCGFHNWLIEHERAEIGYLLHEQFRSQGFMIEALHSMIQFGFAEMHLNRIEAFISPNNLPSNKLISKLGFVQEGLLREHYKHENVIHDSLVYSLLKSEYKDLVHDSEWRQNK